MQLKFITTAVKMECPMFVKTFSAGKIRSAVIEITGLGLFRAFLNGERIGQDYLTPGFNDYDAYLRVYRYDVTDMIRDDNRIEVVLGCGWCMSRLGPNSGEPDHWGHTFLLGARLTMTDVEGHTSVIETDDTWEAFRSPIVMSELYDGEYRDDTVDPGPPAACKQIETAYHLEKPVSPPIRAVERLKPVRIAATNEYVLDFGQNFAGIIRFHSRLKRGETVRWQTGEVLQDGRFFRDNYLTAKSEYRYTSDGVEKTVDPWFCFYGGRYAKVTASCKVSPDDFEGIALSSDLRRTMWMDTGHAGINRLLENCRWSQMSNFIDVPTDCPQRDERLGWLGDAQVFAPTACFQMDCKAFYRKFMRDMREEQMRYYAGDLPMYVPSLRGESATGGAVWADAAILIPSHVYAAYGDRRLLGESYQMMRDYLEKLIQADRRLGNTHIRFDAFTFGDWLAQDGITPNSVFGGTNHAFIQGCFYYIDTRHTASAAYELGRMEDAKRYNHLANEIYAALLSEYVTAGGHLSVDTQTAYALAFFCGLHRDKEVFRKDFKDRLHRDAWRLTTGFTGTPFLLDALFDCGLDDEAWRILLSESFPGWLYEVNLGATTIWERWNSLESDGKVSDTGMNSFNHYAYGSVCGTIYSRVLGIQSCAPGWKGIRVNPHMNARLGHCHGEFHSPTGIIKTGWSFSADGSVTFSIEFPPDIAAGIVVPDIPEEQARQMEEQGNKKVCHYMPTKDYLHPYGKHSVIMDLFTCSDISEWIMQNAPKLAELALDDTSDLRTKSLDELTWGVPRAVKSEAAKLTEWLGRKEYSVLPKDMR